MDNPSETEQIISDLGEALESEVQDTPESPPETVEELVAPEDWAADDVSAFNTLNDEGKKVLLGTHKNLVSAFNKKYDGIADTKKELEAFNSAFSPLDQILEQNGVSRLDALRALIQAQQNLTYHPGASIDSLLSQYGGEQAKDIVQALAKKYGFEIEAVDDGQADPIDPEVKELRAKFHELETRQQQDSQRAQQDRRNHVDNQIKLFREAVDDAGNPLHPHFAEVEPVMTRLISSGQADDLQSAYEQAVRLVPELYNETLEEQRKQAVKDAQESQRKSLEQKKEAARKPGRTPAPDTDAPPNNDLRETLEQAFALHSDGV